VVGRARPLGSSTYRERLLIMSTVLEGLESSFAERVRRRLSEGTVVWFTTVGRDGTPQPNPVWFVWDGADEILIYSRAEANRVAHIKQRPRVSVNLDGNGRGGDILVLTGTATILPGHPLAHENPDYLAKYASAAVRIAGSVAVFSEEHTAVLRFTIEKIRGQ
jgi:PPOX class probable F420-dependent enzyme